VDVVSIGWRQEGLPATKSLHQLPLMECTFSPLFFQTEREKVKGNKLTWKDGRWTGVYVCVRKFHINWYHEHDRWTGDAHIKRQRRRFANFRCGLVEARLV